MTTVAFMDEKSVGSFYAREGKYMGIVSRVETIDKEFGKYKVVYYIVNGIMDVNVVKGLEQVDVWRLSDGPELWLGVVYFDKHYACEIGIYTNFHKDFFIALKGYSQFEAIQQIIGYSEKELEAHYNSL